MFFLFLRELLDLDLSLRPLSTSTPPRSPQTSRNPPPHPIPPPQPKMAYATRNRALSLVFLAGCANEALSLLLKRVVRQPRPERRCTDLGTCGKFGMPSSHTQVSFFFLKDFFFSPLVLGFLSLAVLPRERRRDLFFFTIAIRKKGKIKIEKKKKNSRWALRSSRTSCSAAGSPLSPRNPPLSRPSSSSCSKALPSPSPPRPSPGPGSTSGTTAGSRSSSGRRWAPRRPSRRRGRWFGTMRRGAGVHRRSRRRSRLG